MKLIKNIFRSEKIRPENLSIAGSQKQKWDKQTQTIEIPWKRRGRRLAHLWYIFFFHVIFVTKMHTKQTTQSLRMTFAGSYVDSKPMIQN